MPRTYDSPGPTAHNLVRRVRDLFADPSLGIFRENFEKWIQQRAAAIDVGHSGDFSELERLFAKYESLMPTKPSRRFHLDAWLISNLASSWSNGTVQLPGAIVPLYGKEWSWHALPWAGFRGEAYHVPFAITFPGSDILSDIDLLSYPWLSHELGHGLFAKCSPTFIHSFGAAVEEKCRVLRRKAFADI